MDRELARRAMTGDREAFDALAALSIGRLYGTAALILRDPDRAADATQEALVSAWRDLSAIRDPDRFEAWLHRVLVRCCYREAGRERRRRTVEVRELADVPGVSDASRSLIERDQLERAFRRLDVEERTVIVLHHIEGFLLTEIADLLGIPVGTVKSRLHRGKRTMRAALDADARVIPIEKGRIA
jgi:RNA polymerase sigma-70 factor (ECF subfamily)